MVPGMAGIYHGRTQQQSYTLTGSAWHGRHLLPQAHTYLLQVLTGLQRTNTHMPYAHTQTVQKRHFVLYHFLFSLTVCTQHGICVVHLPTLLNLSHQRKRVLDPWNPESSGIHSTLLTRMNHTSIGLHRLSRDSLLQTNHKLSVYPRSGFLRLLTI